MQYKKAKSNIKKKRDRTSTDKKVAAFFGKLPHIEDGLTYQKKVRSEWK